MTIKQILDNDQTHAVLSHLRVEGTAPTLNLLDDLVHAYTRTVPWESATRIAKWSRTVEINECARWPNEFWRDNLERGGGGTCFESNYAFYSLLRALGYKGYLTINDMDNTRGCHTAIILNLDGENWLVDVGIPLHTPIRINPVKQSHRASEFHNYTLTPAGRSRYEVERDRHPNPYIYTLIDRAVEERAYQQATTADYGEGGFFLDRLIINKVIEDRMWRFDSEEKPYRLEFFDPGVRTDKPIIGDVAETLAAHFGLDEATLRTALDVIGG